MFTKLGLICVFSMLGFCKFPGLDASHLEFKTILNFIQNQQNKNATFSLGGNVTGLNGSGLDLRLTKEDNSSEILRITANGSFTFLHPFQSGERYSVDVANQPVAPFQECVVAGGVGSFASQDIQNIIVECENTGVRPPLFNPNPGNFSTPQTVLLENQSPGSLIVYTLDGTDPDPDCNAGGPTIVYAGSISLGHGTTTEIRTRACFDGEVSIVNFGTYTIDLGTLAQPIFDPPPQASTSNLNISILYPGSETVTIYYSLDTGNIPDCSPNGIEYTGTPIALNSSETMLAIACAPGYSPSPWVVGIYSVNEMVAIPVVDIPAGTYNNDLTINIESTTPDATIVYTLDGTNPSCDPIIGTTGNVANITNNNQNVLRAIGCKAGFNDSDPIGPLTYTLKVGNLSVSPENGIYQTNQNITMTTDTSGASILYTEDQGDPATCAVANNEFTYSAPISVNTGGSYQEIFAIGCKSGYQPSDPVTRTITVNGPLQIPIITDNDPQVLIESTMTTPDPGNQKICYTEDGSNPACADGGVPNTIGGDCATGSTEYTAPFNISISTNLRAILCSEDWLNSPINSADIIRVGTVSTPVFSVDTGTYDNTFSVTITAMGADEIYYTDNGNDPDCGGIPNGTLYTTPINVSETDTMLKAIGCHPTDDDSSVTTVEYFLKAGEVTFNPSIGGLITTPPVELTMETTTNSATIYFTDNGNLPECNISNLYNGMITLESGTNVSYRAIACRPGFDDSDERNISYNITGTLPQPNINKVAVLGVLSILLGNNVTITASGTPAGQRICYRTGTNVPACSLAPNGAPNNLGGFCASGSEEYSGTFYVTGNPTIRAITCIANWIQSPVNVD
ncbi:MAG: chitobiase/beta-hexosaminidase C-terminal domain-containing protein [Leptospira sp.]|nr:chitobiase/beta-hexosaminidase C-terminal domain-containing protein [Leptospira sp.]